MANGAIRLSFDNGLSHELSEECDAVSFSRLSQRVRWRDLTAAWAALNSVRWDLNLAPHLNTFMPVVPL